MIPWRRLCTSYYLLQGIGTLAWWIFLLADHERFALFFPRSSDPLGFLPPDMLFFGAGSLACADAVANRRAWRRPIVWIVAGGVAYPTVLTATQALRSDSGWLGGLFMIVACIGSIACALVNERTENP